METLDTTNMDYTRSVIVLHRLQLGPGTSTKKSASQKLQDHFGPEYDRTVTDSVVELSESELKARESASSGSSLYHCRA